jgi:uncharacterized protein (TIGR02301 family)
MRGVLLAMMLVCAGPALAQDPTPSAERSAAVRADLLDLAQALGESHALAQACSPEDQTWRARMRRLIEVEAPDVTLEADLADRFNAGFNARREEFPKCTTAVAPQRAGVGPRGRTLSERLARSR